MLSGLDKICTQKTITVWIAAINQEMIAKLIRGLDHNKSDTTRLI